MPKSNFPWGAVVKEFKMDFDGKVLTIMKYHPWNTSKDGTVQVGDANESEIYFSCEATSWSHRTIEESVIHWITQEALGLNQSALASGFCRALRIGEKDAS